MNLNRRSFLSSLVLAPFALKAGVARALTTKLKPTTAGTTQYHCSGLTLGKTAHLDENGVLLNGYLGPVITRTYNAESRQSYELLTPDLLARHFYLYDERGQVTDAVDTATLFLSATESYVGMVSPDGTTKSWYPEADLMLRDGPGTGPNHDGYCSIHVRNVEVTVKPEPMPIGMGCGGLVLGGIHRLLDYRLVTLTYQEQLYS